MFNTGIVTIASLFFGITGIGVTMTDPVMAMARAMHMVITRTMARTTMTNQK